MSENVKALRADQPVVDVGDRQLLETMAEYLPKPHLGKCLGFVAVAFYEKGDSEFWHFHTDDKETIGHRIAYAGAVLGHRAVLGSDRD